MKTGKFIRSLLIYSLLIFSSASVFGVIKDSVGPTGANHRADVLWVQKVLNQLPVASGGPLNRLDEDGIFGENTLQAIRRFQTIQLGFSDGLIEPGGRTHARMLEFVDFAEQPRAGPPVAWGAKVTGEFKHRMLEICHGIEVNPDHLMAAMAFETAESFSPAIKNAAGSGATGLIQFMPNTASGLGTSIEALAKMSALQQLDYVEKYFQPFKGKCKTLSDVYMAILWPAAVGQSETHILFDKTTSLSTYRLNRGLDTDDDGRITKQEAAGKVAEKLKKGLQPGFRDDRVR